MHPHKEKGEEEKRREKKRPKLACLVRLHKSQVTKRAHVIAILVNLVKKR